MTRWTTLGQVTLTLVVSWGCSPAATSPVVEGNASASPTGAPVVTSSAPIVPAPTLVKADPAPSLVCGHRYCCSLAEGGAVKCWGERHPSDNLGKEAKAVGSLSTGDGGAVRQSLTGVLQIRPNKSNDHECVLMASPVGTAQCFGDNDDGQLGDGGRKRRASAAPVVGLTGAIDVQAGFRHSCALLSDKGKVQCWGYNAFGALGDGEQKRKTEPTYVKGIEGAVALAIGDEGGCVIVTDGSVQCWGRGDSGALGNNKDIVSLVPVVVQELDKKAIAITSGSYFNCVIVDDGTARCWGSGKLGQIGDGEMTSKLVATKVKGVTKARAISAGYDHVCALTQDGSVWCWGNNKHGQLGDGTTTDRGEPVRLGDVTGVLEIAAGGFRTCVRMADRSVRCWGDAYGDWKTSTEAVTIAGLP